MVTFFESHHIFTLGPQNSLFSSKTLISDAPHWSLLRDQRNMRGIHKDSYNYLTLIFKTGVAYLQKVKPFRLDQFCNTAPLPK
jgi:hypothetical protein